MAPINPPQYLQAGSYTARNDRLMVGSMMTPHPATGPLAIRSGVRPQPDNSGLAVRQRTTPAMSVTVAAGSAFVQSPSATGGCYVVVNDASHDVTITAAHPTLGRRDLIVARVYDAELSGAVNQWALEVVTGTPAGSPVAPGVPSGAISLASVLIAANQTTIVNANITDTRTFTVALGGTIPAPATALPTNPYRGMAAYDTTNLRPTWHNGTGWQSWMEDPNLLSQIIIRCTSSTRPSSPTEGWHIYETDTRRFLVYQSGAWVPEGGERKFALKNANESVTNNSTPQDDDALFVSVLANTNYWINALIIYSGDQAGDLALRWTVPTSATMSWTITASMPTDQEPTSQTTLFNFKFDQAFTAGVGAGGNIATARISGVLRVAGTAGTLRLRWSQATSNANPTTVYADSILVAEKIG